MKSKMQYCNYYIPLLTLSFVITYFLLMTSVCLTFHFRNSNFRLSNKFKIQFSLKSKNWNTRAFLKDVVIKRYASNNCYIEGISFGNTIIRFPVDIDSGSVLMNEDIKVISDDNKEPNHLIEEFMSILSEETLKSSLNNKNVSSDEMVDWIATDNVTNILSLPRKLIYKYNLYHKGIGVIVMDPDGNIFIHLRSPSKRLFPSMYDMFIGGVCSSGESGDSTLKRELTEEIGIDVNNIEIIRNPVTSINSKEIIMSHESLISKFVKICQNKSKDDSYLHYIGDTVILTSYNHCLVHCYILMCNKSQIQNIRFSDGEIVSGKWISIQQLLNDLPSTRESFVPDGLQVWDNLPFLK